MPRCGCAGSTCTCLIVGGTNVEVEGAGTQDNPYVISTAGVDVSDAIRFVDTESVNFTVTGDGTDTDPWTVTAVATPALDDLSDVDAPAPVPENYVLAWNGTAWVPAPPATVEPGAIATLEPITGDGTAANPIGLDLITDDTLTGSGTAADPLGWEIVYAAGTQQVTGAVPGNAASAAVTFPAGRFTDTPFMTLGIYTSIPAERFASHIDKTPNGFTMMLGYTGLSTQASAWITWHAFVRPGSGDNPNEAFMDRLRDLNPARTLVGVPRAAEPEDALATCTVVGCDNNGIAIPVHTHWTDEEGVTRPIGSFQCGVSGQEITNVVEAS